MVHIAELRPPADARAQTDRHKIAPVPSAQRKSMPFGPQPPEGSHIPDQLRSVLKTEQV